MFAASFLQIPPHDGHPCSWLMIRTATLIQDLHLIAYNHAWHTRIDSVMIFTGQAFIALENATIISTLNDDYKILLPTVAWEFNESTPEISGQGFINGAFMEYGKGRVVIFGEAAMFSAQLLGQQQEKMGMNHPGAKQNPQLLLNIIHWLDKKL